MSAGTGVLWRILRERTPIAVAYYPERITREALMEQVRLMAPQGVPVRHVTHVEDAFKEPETILLLTPDDEEAAVAALDRGREAMRGRTAPVVLFLLCDGSGERRLREAYALASWLRGHEYDPERPGVEDIDEMRQDFARRMGRTPEQWLADWRGGKLPDTLENNLLSHEALALEEAP